MAWLRPMNAMSASARKEAGKRHSGTPEPVKSVDGLSVVAAEAEIEVDDPYFSRAVGKSFLMLNLLSLADQPLTLNQMILQAELTKSSCFRLLHTLERLEIVARTIDGRYLLKEKSVGASAARIASALLQVDQRYLRSLNEEFGETVSVAVLFTNHIEVVQTLESARVIRMANTVGRILAPHASSLGKAITAFQPEEVSRKLLVSYGLQRFTGNTITDEKLLREEFERIRERGYASESEESTLDGYCFGVPLYLQSGKSPGVAVAALSISMPKSRLPDGDARSYMVQRLLATARKISAEL